MDEPCEEEILNNSHATKSSWTPLFRQIFVSSGVTSYFFIYGLFFGATTVLVPQIQKEANFTETMSIQTVSWLYSISSYGSLPWSIILPILAEKFGRKVPYFVLWINTIVCVLLFYFSSSVIELFISGFLQGMLLAVQIAVSIMVLTEYTSPKYRGMLITFKSATFFWGIWISNTIGTFLHWKNIGILIFIFCIYNINVVFWPESPTWLATKGRFEECAKSHRWLKGEDKDSEEELKQLILSEKENLRRKNELQNIKHKNVFYTFYKAIKAKRFYKPLIFSLLLTLLYQFSGKLACTGYVIDILKKITENESIAYQGMLVLDAVTLVGMYIGVFLNKVLKRRTLLLGAAFLGVIFLYILSLYLYLVHCDVISENKYLTLLLLTGFSLTISCGPILMSMCLTSEITPIKFRSLFLGIFALLNNSMMGSILKLFPFIFEYFDSHGAFLFFALISSICIYILYKVLPETKDKTILEIEKMISEYNIDEESEKETELMNVIDHRKI